MNRRGLALGAVLLALVVLSAIVATALYTARVEQRAGQGVAEAARAFEGAEAGLALVLGAWAARPALAALPVGDSVLLAEVASDRRTRVDVLVRRLADSLYWVQAEGVALDAGGGVLARRALARLARSSGPGAVPLPQRSWVQVY